MNAAQWVDYVPDAIQHVKSSYRRRTFDPKTGLPDGQEFRVECEVCHAKWGGVCMSGNPRVMILRFAAQHLHRDPLAAERVISPGSRRGTVE